MKKRNITKYAARLLKVMERETEPSLLLSQSEGVKPTLSRLKHIMKLIENLAKMNSHAAVDFV